MFDNLKAMGALAALMKNQDKLKEGFDRVRAKLERTRVTGEAGSGAARAEVTGTLKVLRVELSPALLMGMAADERTRELAASLIADAVNNAMDKAKALAAEEVRLEAKAQGLEDLLAAAPGLTGLLGGGR